MNPFLHLKARKHFLGIGAINLHTYAGAYSLKAKNWTTKFLESRNIWIIQFLNANLLAPGNADTALSARSYTSGTQK